MDTKGITGMHGTSEGISLKKPAFEPESQAAKRAKVEKAAEQFEAMLTRQMTKSMWENTNIKDSLLGSKEEETYRDMYNELLSDELAKGQGIGIKQVIVKELSRTEGLDPSPKQVASKYKAKE